MGLIESLKQMFFTREPYTASREEFDSIVCFGYYAGIKCSYEKIVEHLETIKDLDKDDKRVSIVLFFITTELLFISRNCEMLLIFADRYAIKDEFEVRQMIDALKHETLDLAARIINKEVEDVKTALQDQLKRISNRENDIVEFTRLIAKLYV